jgi:MYXO-CTERM domain-containing protein
MKLRHFATLASWTCLLSACTTRDLPHEEAVGHGDDGIVGGTADTTNDAVVAYVFNGGCSGTIVEVDAVNDLGYVLTAAHCVEGTLGEIRIGDNNSSGYIAYDIIDRDQHPEYAVSGAYDFAMMTFSFDGDAAPPFIPPLTKALDNINTGTNVDLVGYGGTPGGNNLRRHVVKPVSDETPTLLIFSQTSSGVCFGDSGGGSLHTNSGLHVAGVHSFTSSDECTGAGEVGGDVRVSAVVDTFIRPYIDGTAYQPQTCDECTDAHINNGQCSNDTSQCLESTACNDFLDCVDGCSTNACYNACTLDHATGFQLYQDIFDCVCGSACPGECSGDDQCEPPLACLLGSDDSACQTCLEQSCCGEAQSCGVDGTCLNCFATVPTAPACNDNEPTQALLECLGTSCSDECDVEPGTGGAGSGGAGSGGSGSGAGGAGPGGGGPGSGSGAGNNAEDDDDDGGSSGGCACSLPGAQRDGWPSQLGLAALAGLAVAALRRRQRRRNFS